MCGFAQLVLSGMSPSPGSALPLDAIAKPPTLSSRLCPRSHSVWGAAQLALPGTPPGPGSPPPLGAVQVVGYAPLPSGDPAAYLSPRAQLAGGGSAPTSPMRQEWLGVRVCNSPKCLLIPSI